MQTIADTEDCFVKSADSATATVTLDMGAANIATTATIDAIGDTVPVTDNDGSINGDSSDIAVTALNTAATAGGGESDDLLIAELVLASHVSMLLHSLVHRQFREYVQQLPYNCTEDVGLSTSITTTTATVAIPTSTTNTTATNIMTTATAASVSSATNVAVIGATVTAMDVCCVDNCMSVDNSADIHTAAEASMDMHQLRMCFYRYQSERSSYASDVFARLPGGDWWLTVRLLKAYLSLQGQVSN